MRIGTWNLERHGDSDRIRLQRTLIDSKCADVFVLTEVHRAFDCGGWTVERSIKSTHSDHAGDSWVAVVSQGLDLSESTLSPRNSSVAGQYVVGGELLIVYGSVLPWLRAPDQAPDLALPNEPYVDMFARIVREQVEDLRTMKQAHSKAIIVWAGDFNQTLSGSNSGGSNISRKLLKDTLADLGLVAWNEHLAHAIPGLKTIDLICGPTSRPVKVIERFDSVFDGHKLSDHAGYLIEI